MSIMSSTVGIQLTSYTVGNWKTSLVGYTITITLWWYYKSVLTNQLITVGLMNFNPQCQMHLRVLSVNGAHALIYVLASNHVIKLINTGNRTYHSTMDR